MADVFVISGAGGLPQPRKLSLQGEQDVSNTLAEDGSINTILLPLFTGMKLFGLHFKTGRRIHPCSTENSKSQNTSGKRKWYSILKANAPKLYSSAVLVMLWANVVRILTVFVAGDQFGSELVNKVTVVMIFLLSALLQTSSYISCKTGRLERTIEHLQLSPLAVANVKKKSRGRLIFTWLMLLINFLIFYYTAFSSTTVNFSTAPFGTYISINSDTAALLLKIFYSVICTYCLAAWILPLAMHHMLAVILSCGYNSLADDFRRSVDVNGRFNAKGGLRQIRCRHLLLTRAVSDVDFFIRVGNLGGFVCHMVNVVVLLFLAVYDSYTSYQYIVVNFGAILEFGFGLYISTLNGVIVNEAAHKLTNVVHDIDVSSLDQRDANEVRVFLVVTLSPMKLAMLQKSLSGNRIGFTVLGIIVIEKKNILKLVALLVTYFLLMVQLTSRKTSTPSNCCKLCDDFNTTTRMYQYTTPV